MINGSSLEVETHEEIGDNRTALIVIAMVALPIMVFLAGILALPFFNGITIPIIPALLSVALAEIIVVIASWKIVKEPFKELFKINKISLKQALISLSVGTGLLIGLQILSIITTALGAPVSSSDTSMLMAEMSGWERWLALLFLAPVVAPIAEEFFFRGVLYNFLEKGLKKHSVIIATIFSATAFALMHFQGLDMTGLVVLAWTGIFGVLAVWLYRKFNTIWAPIIVHVSYNFLSSVAILALPS